MDINKLERYSHRVILEDGTELVPIKTTGSEELRVEAKKRIGEYRFYGSLHDKKITSRWVGHEPRARYYLTLEDYDKYNNWEDLSKYEALATGDTKFLGRGDMINVDDLSDDFEYAYSSRLLCSLSKFISRDAWSFNDCDGYFFSRPKPKKFKWTTDRPPTAEDADEHGLVACYSGTQYGNNIYQAYNHWCFLGAMPWAKTSDVQRFTNENPAPHPSSC